MCSQISQQLEITFHSNVLSHISQQLMFLHFTAACVLTFHSSVILHFSAVSTTTLTSISSNVVIKYIYYGNVTWLCVSIFRSLCTFDVKYFKYAVQSSTKRFASWSIGMDHLNILSQSDEKGLSNIYLPSSEWVLVKYRSRRQLDKFSCCPDLVLFMKYDIIIK
ncbi:hypothetical protein DPMN_189734 [Dreissena polymorpha]|uniref:Neurotransmitter-gated ion-channel ligand-binding domain-containing protein n=1 Tax=Dreissena polymorpha TaxID=45954 RepID=A0A9D4ICH0_DREPO|nr:hypothetical protein DPMN_189734 [Dreissena polymorpha]